MKVNGHRAWTALRPSSTPKHRPRHAGERNVDALVVLGLLAWIVIFGAVLSILAAVS